MRLLDVVFEAMDLSERVLARVRKTTKRKLERVPDPIEPRDPFAKPAVAEGKRGITDEQPLGDPTIAAQVYGRRGDLWSGRAVRLLSDRGIDHRFVDLEAPEHTTLEPRIVRETKRAEMPWVFVRGALVGGYDALDELDRLGQLEVLVLPPEERDAAPRGGIRIEVPNRTTEATPKRER